MTLPSPPSPALILTADGLSADARQVRVATQNGRVTCAALPFPRRKERLRDLAATVVAADHVDNEIEVREIAARSAWAAANSAP